MERVLIDGLSHVIEGRWGGKGLSGISITLNPYLDFCDMLHPVTLLTNTHIGKGLSNLKTQTYYCGYSISISIHWKRIVIF